MNFEILLKVSVEADSLHEAKVKSHEITNFVKEKHCKVQDLSVFPSYKAVDRLAIYSLNDIFCRMKKGQNKFKVGENEYKASLFSDRLKLFQQSPICYCCGIRGDFFSLDYDYNNGSCHLNLYAFDGGQEVLMTKDHIIPVSKDGKDNYDNYKSCCAICNSIKADSFLGPKQIFEIRKFYNANKDIIDKKELNQIMKRMKEDFIKNEL